MKLKKKVCIITGGGSGIGKTTAKFFAHEGAKVFIVGRRLELLEETINEINKNGGSSDFFQGDITNENDVISIFKSIYNKLGKIDILINNAGVFPSEKPFYKYENDEWNKVFNINLKGTYNCSKYIVPYLIKNNGGSIINVSSASAIKNIKNQSIYSVSKAAVEKLSKCMAIELAKYNIRVNIICPGLVDTDMASERFDKKGKKIYIKSYPLGRLGITKDISLAALFLASDDSNWITGTTLVVDGGLTLD